MSFDQTDILEVVATPTGKDLKVSWVSSAAPGTFYQCYVNRVLSWFGSATSCVVPMPPSGITASIDVGTVLASEAPFTQVLGLPVPGSGGQRVTLTWVGGSFLGSVDHFNVYSGLTPGGAVSYAKAIGRVVAYEQGIVTDGAGIGPAGYGIAGVSAASYFWTSLPLAPGTWNFGVKPADANNVEGSASTFSATVAGPPKPPARNAAGKRLTYTYTKGGPGPINGAGIGGAGMGTAGIGASIGAGDGGAGYGGAGSGGSILPSTAQLSWLSSPGY